MHVVDDYLLCCAGQGRGAEQGRSGPCPRGGPIRAEGRCADLCKCSPEAERASRVGELEGGRPR